MENVERPIQREHLIRQVEFAFDVVKNLQDGKDPYGNRLDRRDHRLFEFASVIEEARQFVFRYAQEQDNQYILQQVQTIPAISPDQFRTSTAGGVWDLYVDKIPFLQLFFAPIEIKQDNALRKFLNAAHPAFNRILSVLKQPGMEEFFQQVK